MGAPVAASPPELPGKTLCFRSCEAGWAVSPVAAGTNGEHAAAHHRRVLSAFLVPAGWDCPHMEKHKVSAR